MDSLSLATAVVAAADAAQWEFDVLHWFQSIHNGFCDFLSAFLSFFGEAGIVWIVIAAICLIIPKYRKYGFAIAISLILSLIFCNGILKPLFHRGRPYWDVNDPSLLDGVMAIKDYAFGWMFKVPVDHSFPSGHSSATFAVAIAVFGWNKKAGCGILAIAIATALSRLYLSVHYPTDVLVGTVMGIILGVFAYLLSKFVIKKIEEYKKMKENA